MTEYDSGYLIGAMFGVILACAALAAMFGVFRKKHSLKGDYDERQRFVQGKGFHYAYETLFVCVVSYILFGSFTEPFVSGKVLLFAGLTISALVYVAYVIWNDSYFALNDKPAGFIWTFAAIAVWNLFEGILELSNDGMGIENRDLDFGIVQIITGIAILLVLALLLFRRFCKKEETMEEE